MIPLDATPNDTYAVVDTADATARGAAQAPSFSVPQARHQDHIDAVTLVEGMIDFASRPSALDATAMALDEPILPASDKPDVVATLANHRMRLLARKYASGDSTPEEIARLELLRLRLAKLVPVVTSEMVDHVEAVSASLLKVEERTAAILARLGVK